MNIGGCMTNNNTRSAKFHANTSIIRMVDRLDECGSLAGTEIVY